MAGLKTATRTSGAAVGLFHLKFARAGEAGKGFTVAANEIKDLAGQTAEATLEIRQGVERHSEFDRGNHFTHQVDYRCRQR